MTDLQEYAAPTADAALDLVPHLTPYGLHLLRYRYLKPDPNSPDGFEEPVEMFRRVARNLAEAERAYDPTVSDDVIDELEARFFRVMVEGDFLPNAPTLLGAGRPLQQLLACYVLPVEDSIEGVFESLRNAAILHARGSGTGFSFSALRSRGAPIASGGFSTGPVPLMRIFDTETDVIKAGGTHWGANMGVLRCDHPDIEEFVEAKARGGLRNFNISVGITDAFMECWRAGGDFPLIDPVSGSVVRTVAARTLMREISSQAWATGDPGLFFLDRVEAANPTPRVGRLESSAPCGEAPLLPFEACCLAGVNVSRHVRDGDLDAERLADTARLGLHLMDNVITATRFPLEEIAMATTRNRKIGVGVMGFADLLITLGIPYDSGEAVALARKVMHIIKDATHEESVRLAAERGTFPAFEESVLTEPVRNATTTANAPNSTIGAIAGCSLGIEPLFAVGFDRHLDSGAQISELHPRFVEIAHARGFASDALFEEVLATGSVQHIEAVPDDVKRVFVTSHEVSPEWHVRVQAAFQESTDLAVSKTINMPHHASVDDVERVYLQAYETGCKGVTIYRDRCQETQFMITGARTDGRVEVGEACEPGGQCKVC